MSSGTTNQVQIPRRASISSKVMNDTSATQKSKRTTPTVTFCGSRKLHPTSKSTTYDETGNIVTWLNFRVGGGPTLAVRNSREGQLRVVTLGALLFSDVTAFCFASV